MKTQFVPKSNKVEHKLTDKIIHEIIAIALAESNPNDLEQAKKIFWVYYNIFKEKGESGFSASYAYKGKNYKLFMTMLGENDYADAMYDKKYTYAQFAKGEYVNKYDKQPTQDVVSYVNQIKDLDEKNPYQNFMNNGSIEDLNAESSGAKKHPQMWNEVRTYYKLQQDKKVSDIYVVNIGEGATSSFIFNLPAIEKYLKNNKVSVNNTPKINSTTGDFSPAITTQKKSKKKKHGKKK